MRDISYPSYYPSFGAVNINFEVKIIFTFESHVVEFSGYG